MNVGSSSGMQVCVLPLISPASGPHGQMSTASCYHTHNWSIKLSLQKLIDIQTKQSCLTETTAIDYRNSVTLLSGKQKRAPIEIMIIRLSIKYSKIYFHPSDIWMHQNVYISIIMLTVNKSNKNKDCPENCSREDQNYCFNDKIHFHMIWAWVNVLGTMCPEMIYSILSYHVNIILWTE